MTTGRENGYLVPTFSLRGVLTFVASGLDINGCVLRYFEGQQIYTVIQAVHSLLYIVEKCHFFSFDTWKDNKIFTKMWVSHISLRYCIHILGVARYMYAYQTITVRTSRFGAWGLTTNTGNSAPTVMQHWLITASASRRTANAVSCTLENNPHFWFWTRLSHGLTKDSHMDWQELCARVSYLSHSAQIQIFHNISMFAM